VMTTQILASRQNGDVDIAEVETFFLIAVAIAGLLVARALERRHPGRRAATQRGTPPERRRQVRSPPQATHLTLAGWLFALLAAAAASHADPDLLRAAGQLDDRALPAGAVARQLPGPRRDGRGGTAAEALRPVANSLWMALAATAGALVLGFVAARRAIDRRPGGAFWARPIGTPRRHALGGAGDRLRRGARHHDERPARRPPGAFCSSARRRFCRSPTSRAPCLPPGQAAIAALEQMDPQLEEAAASLGAGKLRTLVRVTLPRVRPALAAGASLAFLAAFGDFVVSIVLYTYETRPISIEILSNLRLQETGVAAVYGVLLTALSAAAFLLWGREKEAR
jgi:iron(III) transport system permease protein